MRHTTARAPRFDREWKEMIALLPENRQSVIELAIREYQLSGAEPSGLEGAEMMAFLLIKKIVDRRAKQRTARLRRSSSRTTPPAHSEPLRSVSDEPVVHSVESVHTCPEPTSPIRGQDCQTHSLRSRGHNHRKSIAQNKRRKDPAVDSRHQAIIRQLNRQSKKARCHR